MSDKSDGSTASYYELPDGCTELQHLISYRNLNAQDGEIFRAIYRKGRASHSDELRDARKVLFYAKAEVERLEALAVRAAPFPDTHLDFDEERVDRVASSHGDGEHYAEDMTDPANWRAGDFVECLNTFTDQFTEGSVYRLRKDVIPTGYQTAQVHEDDEGERNGWGVENFRFHSRPSAGGWIEWAGGECPCDGLSQVEVKYMGSTESTINEAQGIDWASVRRYRML